LALEPFTRNKRRLPKIGELVIGRGALRSYYRGRTRSKRISWTRVFEMMDKLAYGD